MIFTLVVVISLFWAQSVGALTLAAPNAASVSTGTICGPGTAGECGRLSPHRHLQHDLPPL